MSECYIPGYFQINWALVDPSSAQSYDIPFHFSCHPGDISFKHLQRCAADHLSDELGRKVDERHIWFWKPKEYIAFEGVNSEEWFKLRDNLRTNFRLCFPSMWSPFREPIGDGSGTEKVSIFDNALELHFVVVIDAKVPTRK